MRRSDSNAARAARGQVIWITGLSGAGKSTLALQVVERLRQSGRPTLLLDGDAVREVVADPGVGHDRDSRLTNAMRICRLAKLAADQGLAVVVATMSLFKEVHAWNRAHLPHYCEVLVKVRLEILKHRDARGLYSRAERGEAANVVGVHVPYDEPQDPHLSLLNEGSERELTSLVDRILEAASERISLSQTPTHARS
ncbi:MAG: adenylyl-sulfate kinase [Verrucomicrobia bacterium]|nr:adenylyl-sulfate kinase [Verrucomicrobiota bacterium]